MSFGNCWTRAIALGLFVSGLVYSSNVSYSGTFTRDNQVELFNVSVTGGPVDIRTYSYGGGVTSAGATIAPGGFDTILTLFSSSGVLLNENDDGVGANVDPVTGISGDSRITTSLAAGNYIVAISQWDNFVSGTNLSTGFVEQGNPNFTADPLFASGGSCPGNVFRDISGTAGRCRSGNWTVDFVDVSSVTPGSPVPEPNSTSLLALALGMLGIGVRLRKERKWRG